MNKKKKKSVTLQNMTETQSLHIKELIVLRLNGALPGILPFPLILRYKV